MAFGSPQKQETVLLLSCVFIASFSVMALEIAASRLLSVLLSYHYVFWVLSTALLGLGTGALLAWLRRPGPLSDEEKLLFLGRRALLFSFSIPVSVFLTVQAGGSAESVGSILTVGPILCAPFAAAGFFLADCYRFFARVSHRLYALDLLGAGAGAWGAVALLDYCGALRVHFLIGAATALAAIVLTWGRRPRSKRLPALGVCGMVICLGLASGPADRFFNIPIGGNPQKEIHDALNSFQGEVAESRWTAFGRTDLVRYPLRPESMDLYLDGTAGSPMYGFSGRPEDLSRVVEKELADFPGVFPFRFLRAEARRTALVIGPGGGRDVLLALWGGFQKITAVEINADLVDIVRAYSGFNGGIYADYPGVSLVVDEGRRFVRSRTEAYDLILLSLPVTNTSRSLEGFALTENFLFTLESVAEYWERLSAHGSLAVVGHNDAEILRLLVLTLNMMEKQGFRHPEAMQHIYVVSSGDYLCLVLRKAAFTQAESREMHCIMVAEGFQPGSSYFPFTPAVNPSLLALALGRIAPEDLIRQVQAKGWDIRPVTDNRPFFYKLEAGVPRTLWISGGTAVVLFAIVLMLPWALNTRRRSRPETGAPSMASPPLPARAAGLFSLLGVGFMVAELSLLARFSVLFASPSIAMAVVLSGLLGWAGLGSSLSRRWLSDAPQRRLGIASLAIVLTIFGLAALLPWCLPQVVQLDGLWRLAACIGLLMPLGLMLGIPFPSAVQWLGRLEMESHIPWMYAINGVGSVAGAAMALLVAVQFGFQQALMASAGCYLLVFLLVRKAWIQEPKKSRATIGKAVLT